MSSAVEAELWQQMLDNPDMADAIEVKVRRILRTSEADFITGIGQPHAGRWETEDYLAFAQVWTGIQSGQLAVFRVELGAFPAPDRHRRDNATALGELWAPFSAYLDPDQNVDSRGDGTFSWDEATPATVGGVGTAFLSPRTVPIEVGSSRPTTTLRHTFEHGGVARWPYESQDIVVIAPLDPHAAVERFAVDY